MRAGGRAQLLLEFARGSELGSRHGRGGRSGRGVLKGATRTGDGAYGEVQASGRIAGTGMPVNGKGPIG